MIPWWQWMLSSVWLNPLLASINTPTSVIPTVSIRDCFVGFFIGTKIEFIGLSDIPLPTCSLRRVTEILCFLSSFLGPIPLSIKSCGLPIAPAETIISLPLFSLRKAWWCLPFSSLNWTPIALGFLCPVQEMNNVHLWSAHSFCLRHTYNFSLLKQSYLFSCWKLFCWPLHKAAH